MSLENKLQQALKILENCPEFCQLIPEVRSNLVFAKEKPQSPADVLAVDGRITVVNNLPKAAGQPKFGVSSHMARLIIALNKKDPNICAGINFFNSQPLVKWLKGYCQTKGWVFSVIDRNKEPEEIVEKETCSAEWKIDEAVRAAGGKVPKIFYESEAVGKEPLSYLVGQDPVSVVNDICKLAVAAAKQPGLTARN